VALEHIKGCETTTVGDNVVLSGIDKLSGKKITLTLNKKEFDAWQNGFPARYAFPTLTLKERRFLMSGTSANT
jgi:hypothetical protein